MERRWARGRRGGEGEGAGASGGGGRGWGRPGGAARALAPSSLALSLSLFSRLFPQPHLPSSSQPASPGGGPGRVLAVVAATKSSQPAAPPPVPRGSPSPHAKPGLSRARSEAAAEAPPPSRAQSDWQERQGGASDEEPEGGREGAEIVKGEPRRAAPSLPLLRGRGGWAAGRRLSRPRSA